MVSLLMLNDDYLDTLREFIDFINRQVGVYMDAIAGFGGNKARIELQTARIKRRHWKGKDIDGANIVVGTSLEDPRVQMSSIIAFREQATTSRIIPNADTMNSSRREQLLSSCLHIGTKK
jgi:hypothetical protein